MLDLWVTKADGATIVPKHEFAKARENTAWLTDDKWIGDEPGSEPCKLIRWGPDLYGVFSPSTTWSDGGPLIDKHRINFATMGTGPRDENGREPVVAITYDGRNAMTGPTHLIAAMRAIVRDTFGDTVPDEQEPA
jgi:hypothetical protein